MITKKDNGYIISFQSEGENDNEYLEAIKIMETCPTPRDGYGYRLREDLTWEEYELPNEKEI